MIRKKIPEIIGGCKDKKYHKYIVYYSGFPSKDYGIILCEKHLKQSPFNKNILKVMPLEET